MSNKKVTKTVGRTSIWQGGKLHKEGDKIELTENQVENINLSPSKEVITKTVEVEKKIPAELTNEQRIRLIVGYWPSFKEEDLTQKGLPKVEAVEDVIGFVVSAKDIEDAATLVGDFENIFKKEK